MNRYQYPYDHEHQHQQEHDCIDVYRVAFDAMLIAVQLSKRVPRGYRSFADQIKRSASSVVAQIAEGANRLGPGEKRQKFSGARGEAGETAAWAELLVGIEVLGSKKHCRWSKGKPGSQPCCGLIARHSG